MAEFNDLADYQWLTGDEAAALAAQIQSEAAPLHIAVRRLRDHFSPARTHLLLELVGLRRRAAAKYTAADLMFFTPLGLEQATDEWVAAYKASRFERAGSSSNAAFVDLCCGIGGDLLALAHLAASSPTPATIVAVDSNPIMTHVAAANVQSILPVETAARVSFQTSNAESFELLDSSAWHIDPDRRPMGRRTTSLDWSNPNRESLERMLTAAPNAAIKLAPAADLPAEWAERCELEWISRDRECRQLVAWHGALAQSPGLRRATILPNSESRIVRPAELAVSDAPGNVPRTIIGTPNERLIIAPRIDSYVFDADPAVMAARLKGGLAAEHGLSAIAAGPTYLTGPQPLSDAALACFEVLDVLPLRKRTVADYLSERGIGQLEIETRGVEIDPQRLRRDLKLRGDDSATLLLTSMGRRQLAIVARRQ